MVSRRSVALLALAAVMASTAGCGTIPCSNDGSVLDLFLQFARMCQRSKSLDPRASGSGTDFDAYRRMYEEMLPDTHDGRELAVLLERFRDEAAARSDVDEPLRARGLTLLDQWDTATRALVDGMGAQTLVTQPMVDSLDIYLARLAGTGSPGLAQAIASERKARPPLQVLVGLDMDTANAALFPPERLFRDDFE